MTDYTEDYVHTTSKEHMLDYVALKSTPFESVEQRMYDDVAALLLQQHDHTCHNLTVYDVVGEFVNFRLARIGLPPVRNNGV